MNQSTEILISPPGGGKTLTCLRRIQSLLHEQPFASIRVVLPDRLQADAFRRRLALTGGALGVQVGSFGDLYRLVLDLAGTPIPVATAPLAHRLVQAAISSVFEAGQLGHFASLRQTPGFALTLQDSFAELKRALVYPDDFTSQAKEAGPTRQELARLYTAYQDLLQRLDWADPEGLSWLAVRALEENPILVNDLALLVVDGFDSFTNAQRRTLQLLAPRLPSILVTLPGDLPFRRPVHRRFEKAYQSLTSSLEEYAAPPRRLNFNANLPAQFKYLERMLFETEVRPLPDPGPLNMLEARSPAEEAREALRWIKARIVRDKLSIMDCAIITPNPDVYHPYLRLAAAEFDLNLRFTQSEPLLQAPAAEALLNLLSLPVQDYPRRPLLDAIRSPFFEHQLTSQDADVLEEIGRFGQVLKSREQWAEVFERLEHLKPGSTQSIDLIEQPGADEGTPPRLPVGSAGQALHQRLEDFFTQLHPPDRNQSLTGWIAWLEDLLDHWQYFQAETEDERDIASFNQVRATFRALVQGEAVTGAQELDYAGFYMELLGALEGAGYQDAPLHSRQPALLVMRIIEARGVRFRAAAVLGLSEGSFPSVERADPFLDEDLRVSLGLESRLQREQSSLFYQAVTRADQHLLLTRPYLADDGERWEPSPYWKAAAALVPAESIRMIRPDDPRPFNDAASPQEALFWAVRAGSLPEAEPFKNLAQDWENLQYAARVLQARLSDEPEGIYEGQTEDIVPDLQNRFGSGHVWSPSRLESYGTCPQQFYISQALGLETRSSPEPGFDAAQLGTLLHNILEHAYRAAGNPADPQSVLEVLPAIAARAFAAAPADQGFRPSPLWQKQQEQFLLILEKDIQELAGQDPAAGWQPAAFELPYGRQGSPPLAVHLQGETILLHGIIDRVDRDAAGRLRIIDYKTGSSHLANADLIQGRRLQLPLYALAAERELSPGQVVEGLYWMLLRAEPASLKLSTFKYGGSQGPETALEMVLSHLERIISGIREGRFEPIPPKGGCPAYCPAAAWCWRYKPSA